jgi:uncharacterized protein
VLAAELGCGARLVSELLRRRARPDVVDKHGRDATMAAAAHGQVDVLRLLLAREAEAARGSGAGAATAAAATGAVRRADAEGLTALMLAAARPSAACVEILLEAGADVQALDGVGRPALLHAADAPKAAAMAAASGLRWKDVGSAAPAGGKGRS